MTPPKKIWINRSKDGVDLDDREIDIVCICQKRKNVEDIGPYILDEGWISLEDNPPDLEDQILVWSNDYGRTIANQYDGKWYTQVCVGLKEISKIGATLWTRLLPEPPEGK